MANPTAYNDMDVSANYDGGAVRADQYLDTNGVTVVTTRQANVADPGAHTTVGSNTGTSGAGLSLIGDTTAVNQASNLMNDLVALQEDIDALHTAVVAILDILENHGLMADS